MSQIFIKKPVLGVALIASLTVSACSSVSLQKISSASEKIDSTSKQIETENARPIVRNQGMNFIGSKIINRKTEEESLPEGFSAQVVIGDGSLLTLSQIGQRITAATKIPVNISPDLLRAESLGVAKQLSSQSGANSQSVATTPSSSGGASTEIPLPMMSLAFVGQLSDCLNRVSSRMSVAYEYRDGAINFSRYISHVYTLNMFPGKSTQSASVGKSGSAATGTSGGTTGGSSGSFSSSSVSDFTSELDSWSTVKDAIDALKTAGGRYSISPSTGIIVLTDTKDSQDRVSKYIKKLEKAMNRQITIRVTVMMADRNDSDAGGMNWNLVWNRLSAIAPNYSLTFSGVKNPAALGQTGGSAGLNILTPTGGAASMWSGSTAMFQALSSVTKTSTISDNTLSTLNKQPLSMAIADQTGYVETAMQQGVTGGNPIASSTVKMLTTGFILNMTPSVTDGDEVSLQFSLDLSNPPVITPFGQNQVPAFSGTQLGQRAKLHDGQTLILSGFSLKNLSSGKSGMFTPNDPVLMGGNHNMTGRDRDMVVLITPILD